MKNEIYQAVTDKIVAMLEAGTKPWAKSWTDASGTTRPVSIPRPRRANGEAYRGINVINLWFAKEARGFRSDFWLTYKGAAELGGQVRKGAKSELAFYVGKTTIEAKNEGDDDRTVSFMRTYCVFNADEIEGLPARFYAPAEAPAAPLEPITGRLPEVDAFFRNTGMSLAHGGNRAYYQPSIDAVRMPEFAQFASAEAYYATLAHEAVHWTGAEARCNRTMGKRFGTDEYAAEELVAELGAAFLCADLEISNAPRADHADYLAGWLKVLKADNRAIFTAASLADRAAAFLHGAQPAELAEAA